VRRASTAGGGRSSTTDLTLIRIETEQAENVNLLLHKKMVSRILPLP